MEIKLASRAECTGCGACNAVCPRQAIKMEKNTEGFFVPCIDHQLCVKCHQCEAVCPVYNLVKSSGSISKAIILKSKDDNIRMSSSSGGVFSHLAGYILSKKGFVVGVVFTEKFHSVKHVMVSDVNDIPLFRCSKYLQSDMGDIYQQVASKLREDKYVLFSGTGCQIAGLRAYLNKEYEKLILVDVICHGVPSQDFWSRYLTRIETNYRRKATYVNFRSKKLSWEKFGLEAQFGESVYFKLLKDDPYLEIFQRNLSLRESCYYCKYKSVTGVADISIGDLWGADQIAPDFNDDRGISFILIHSNKGLELINAIRDRTFSKEIELEKAIAHNRSIAHPAVMPAKRKQFFEDLYDKPFSWVLKKYTRISNRERIKRALVRTGLLTVARRILHRGGKSCN